MDDKKERLKNLKRRRVMWYGRDGLSMGHTEVIDFPQPEKKPPRLGGGDPD